MQTGSDRVPSYTQDTTAQVQAPSAAVGRSERPELCCLLDPLWENGVLVSSRLDRLFRSLRSVPVPFARLLEAKPDFEV
jgi:DNA invertase Pin-like site-specific DNA recombinase